MEIVQAVKKLNSISRKRLNFRRRPILCTTLYRTESYASEQLWWHIWPTFPSNFFIKFSQKMPLYLFYTIVQKSQKWPKTQIKGWSCLKSFAYSCACCQKHWQPGNANTIHSITLKVSRPISNVYGFVTWKSLSIIAFHEHCPGLALKKKHIDNRATPTKITEFTS